MKISLTGILVLLVAITFAQQPVTNQKQFAVVKTDAEWKQQLSADAYTVLRKKGTEKAFTGELWDNHQTGSYYCAGCGNELFSSIHKFESGTGWPSFYQPIVKGRVADIPDHSYGMTRTEVICNRCGGHLGHVFDDGPEPTGLRYCINSVSLTFRKK
jgi:peptide-methionine (R)-S-oxide reductase